MFSLILDNYLQLQLLDHQGQFNSVQSISCVQLFEKDPDAGKNYRQEEKGVAEDEMVGWHH